MARGGHRGSLTKPLPNPSRAVGDWSYKRIRNDWCEKFGRFEDTTHCLYYLGYMPESEPKPEP